MVGTGGGDQQRLGGDAPAVFASPQKQATNGFRSRRATRLARGDSACSLAGEPITEQAGLGGFAHPLPAFKRDQPPCPGLGPQNPNSERKPRSEGRRGGEEWVSTCRYGGSPYHKT